MKPLIRALFVVALLFTAPAFAAEYVDVWLKISGPMSQVKNAFKTLGLDKEMLRLDEDGNLQLTVFNHDVAMVYVPDLITKYATLDKDGNILTPAIHAGSHLMVRFISPAAKNKGRQKILDAGGLPPGLQRVPAPTTMKWAGD